jgi:lysophospholipase L1-like esterase
MKSRMLFACSLLALAPAAAAADPALDLRDGDRVVLLGNTLIEREPRYGYWETALVSRFPNRKVTYRNLGWSGDTVWGEARAGFGTAEDGFRRLVQQVQDVKPTVILIAYGGNESFAGEAGLPHFRQGLDRLLDALAPTKARLVLLGPTRQEDLGRPLPDPAGHNRNLQLYRDAIRQTAEKRGCPFVDLFDLIENGTPAAPLTDNGIHLTGYGYWRSAPGLERALGFGPRRWHVEIDAAGQTGKVVGTRLAQVKSAPPSFQATDARLPLCPPPGAAHPDPGRVLQVRGLAPGRYVLRVDGKPVTAGSAEEWAAGVSLRRGPEFGQSEKLRKAIIAKNELYFHRWRPENETYLFGFRKHEQGQNAREVPQFDPLVERADDAIARLRVPLTHRYELIRD